MKPTRGRIVDFYRSHPSALQSQPDHLETFPALIIEADLKRPREDLEGKMVPWPDDEENSYLVRLHVFGRNDDAKSYATYSDTPKAGTWSWPEYIKRQEEQRTKAAS